VFVCHPGEGADPEAEEACGSEILTTLARRAYRGAASAVDLGRLMAAYQDGHAKGGFEAGVQMGLRRILASPKFLVRAERTPADLPPGEVYRITDLELASRLSFFLWSSIPDDELLTLAAEGRLSEPAVLEQQVRRLLADPRSASLVENFAGQWLQLRNLANTVPNSEEFPDFDDNLRRAFLREAELFVASIVQEDRSVLDLLRADYSFVNERLARHYGMPGIYGSQFRRVRVADERAGLLGKGAVLTVTSHADRTSPVLRGKWILEILLGTPPPPPPPDVPALEETDGVRPRTMREQMEVHRASPACASCHKLMDPLGLALEHFDATGAWRTRDAGEPIDASSTLADGSVVDGVTALREALLARPKLFVGAVTEKLMTYALGRGLDYHDMPAVRQVLRDSALKDHCFSSLVLGIVRSAPFQMRTRTGE
jgi:hypothetical protein